MLMSCGRLPSAWELRRVGSTRIATREITHSGTSFHKIIASRSHAYQQHADSSTTLPAQQANSSKTSAESAQAPTPTTAASRCSSKTWPAGCKSSHQTATSSTPHRSKTPLSLMPPISSLAGQTTPSRARSTASSSPRNQQRKTGTRADTASRISAIRTCKIEEEPMCGDDDLLTLE
jgi:hypothetical protein